MDQQKREETNAENVRDEGLKDTLHKGDDTEISEFKTSEPRATELSEGIVYKNYPNGIYPRQFLKRSTDSPGKEYDRASLEYRREENLGYNSINDRDGDG